MSHPLIHLGTRAASLRRPLPHRRSQPTLLSAPMEPPPSPISLLPSTCWATISRPTPNNAYLDVTPIERVPQWPPQLPTLTSFASCRCEPRRALPSKRSPPKAAAVGSTVVKGSTIVESTCSLDKNILPAARAATVEPCQVMSGGDW